MQESYRNRMNEALQWDVAIQSIQDERDTLDLIWLHVSAGNRNYVSSTVCLHIETSSSLLLAIATSLKLQSECLVFVSLRARDQSTACLVLPSPNRSLTPRRPSTIYTYIIDPETT